MQQAIRFEFCEPVPELVRDADATFDRAQVRFPPSHRGGRAVHVVVPRRGVVERVSPVVPLSAHAVHARQPVVGEDLFVA